MDVVLNSFLMSHTKKELFYVSIELQMPSLMVKGA